MKPNEVYCCGSLWKEAWGPLSPIGGDGTLWVVVRVNPEGNLYGDNGRVDLLAACTTREARDAAFRLLST